MRLITITLLTLFLLGCSSNGTLTLKLTDAPVTGLEKLEVTVSNVEVHAANADEDSGWTTVVSEPKTYDLIAIKDVRVLLGSKELAAGKYTQIRLNVDKAVATIAGGRQEVTIPSGTVKLIEPFDIVLGEETLITLDFDAEESLKVTPKDKYVMEPVIKILS